MVLVLAVILCSGFYIHHEFYVSLAEIRYNPKTECMEVSLRIFPDDMDRVLEERWGITTSLVTELEHPAADSLVESYLADHFQIELDGTRLPLTYLGKEAESDVMWCYLESEPIGRPAEIMVYNSLLTEVFEGQVNITQVYVGKWNRGLLLKREQTRGHLIIGK